MVRDLSKSLFTNPPNQDLTPLFRNPNDGGVGLDPSRGRRELQVLSYRWKTVRLYRDVYLRLTSTYS